MSSPMSSKVRQLTFVIHFLNPWGGHEKSTLEIFRRLTWRFPNSKVLTYGWEDLPENRQAYGPFSLENVRPVFRHPVILLIFYFLIATFFRLIGRKDLVHATGACSAFSDVVQIQFLNTAWKQKKDEFQAQDLFRNPSTRRFSKGQAIFGLRGAFLNFYHESLLKINVMLEKFLYGGGKTYIVISDSVKSELAEGFGIVEQVHVIRHGVDSVVFCPNEKDRSRIRKSLDLNDQNILILFVGEYERKGLASVIHAVARMPEEVRGKVRVLAVGGGDQDGFRSLADSLNISGQVILRGHSRDVVEYYRAADLFLLPTFYEPFGLVILEAMASALPVIVSANAGAAELIKNGISGFKILDPGNIDEIIKLLLPLCEDAELRKKTGAEGRKVAEARSWDQVALEYEKVLRPLVEKS